MSSYGGELNAPLVVFLVIVGAAVAVTIGFAVNRLFHLTDVDVDADTSPSDSQRDYMRQQRLRNRTYLMSEAHGPRLMQSRDM